MHLLSSSLDYGILSGALACLTSGTAGQSSACAEQESPFSLLRDVNFLHRKIKEFVGNWML
jgi:hypothetical protein